MIQKKHPFRSRVIQNDSDLKYRASTISRNFPYIGVPFGDLKREISMISGYRQEVGGPFGFT